ncbi:MAG: alpha/beta hydrolase [Gaiellales bacterium]
MRRSALVVCGILLTAAVAGAAPQAQPLAGTWVGGYSLAGAPTSLVLDNGTAGRLGAGQQATSARVVARRGGQLLVTLGNRVSLRGRVTSGRFAGRATRGAERGRFELRRVLRTPQPPIAAFDGLYRTPEGHALSLHVNGSDRVWATDYTTGALRIAWRTGTVRVSAGPVLNGTYPFSDTTAVFDGGKARSITVGGRTADRVAERTVRAEWRNGDVKLVGKLRLPPGAGPFPAVVILHGSEGGLRDTYDLWTSYWVSRGIAALSYDKRGGGESTGTAVNNNARIETLTALAGDAAAAVDWLRGRADIDPTRIGLAGGSQAGWTIPLTAARQPGVHWAVILSGPVTSVGHESIYSALTQDGGRAISDDEAWNALRDAPQTGFDPRPVITTLRIPILWAWGAVDRSVFAPESAAELERLSPGRDFTGKLYPGGQHGLLLTRTGADREVPSSPGFVPGLFTDIARWLDARAITR